MNSMQQHDENLYLGHTLLQFTWISNFNTVVGISIILRQEYESIEWSPDF